MDEKEKEEKKEMQKEMKREMNIRRDKNLVSMEMISKFLGGDTAYVGKRNTLACPVKII